MSIKVNVHVHDPGDVEVWFKHYPPDDQGCHEFCSLEICGVHMTFHHPETVRALRKPLEEFLSNLPKEKEPPALDPPQREVLL